MIADASSNNSINDFSTFFHETGTGSHSPRSVFIDLESSLIDAIRTSKYQKLFHPNQLISGKEDSMNLYHMGSYVTGRENIDVALDRIRILAENCSNLQGFLFFFGISGGTGSGFGGLICDRMRVDYNKKTTIGFAVFPSPNLSDIVVEPYNSVLCLHDLLENQDAVVVLDNEALYDICSIKLNIDKPSFTNINQIISQTISSLTASFRFEGSLNLDLTEFQTNLIPYPRLHFLLSSYSPIIPAEQAYYEILSVSEITNTCFEPCNMMVKCNTNHGKYMACCLMYRGDVVPADLSSAIACIKNKKTIEFVD